MARLHRGGEETLREDLSGPTFNERGNSTEKGVILFEERKISNLLALSLVGAGYVASFAFGYLAYYSVLEDVTESLSWATIVTVMTVSISLPFVLMRRYPLVIYEKGLDAPVFLYKFSQRGKRFLPFSKIKSIHPEYIDTFGVSKLGGYSIVTTEDGKIQILDVDENKLRTVRSALQSALGDKWDSLYIETPSLGFEEIQRLRQQLSRSKKSVWTEGLGIISISFVLAILSMFLFSSALVFLVMIMVSLFGMIIGISRIAVYYASLSTYKRAVAKDPSLEKVISAPVKVSPEEFEPIRRVQNYTDEDWRKLEKRIHEYRPWLLILTGFVVLIVGTLLRHSLSFVVYSILLLAGMATMMGAILFVPGLTRSTELVKALVEIELREGKRIMPSWFRTRRRFTSMLPFREVPSFGDREWRKLVRGSRFRDERRMAAFVSLLVSLIILSLVIPRVLSIPRFVGLVIFAFSMGCSILYLFVYGSRASTLRAIEEFEEQSGKKIIPERYRSQIFKGWKFRGKD